MLSKLTSLFARFSRDEKGVTLVEYGIALILAIAVGTIALTNLGNEVSGQMDDAQAAMGDNVADVTP
ncbi:Flp family type IVb pilin [Tabrizicola sp. J26]|uniref:Flp family type IVb pilin n=1 Tax=Alitabrizicola rongguiensis TaxID=2909234 RepID=UPI001F2FAECC|nr:Flp family type IVb pilin [Tabrizicola rongguiensis]MCF1710971.1 Flp family type IVb pilin [Tabrizicola rongguiensis]